MNLAAKIEEFASTVEPSDGDHLRIRMRAAMRIGARLALEQVAARGNYLSPDIKSTFEELDTPGGTQITGKVSLSIPIPPAVQDAIADIPPAAPDLQPFKSESEL